MAFYKHKKAPGVFKYTPGASSHYLKGSAVKPLAKIISGAKYIMGLLFVKRKLPGIRNS
jgi:hypothetical protein